LNRALPVRNEKNEIKLWVGAATDIHDQKNFTNELERKVDERTRQLAAKNRELESQNAELASFTYIASHDLQEPLRKIQVFSSRILDKEQQNFSEIGKDYFARIRKAASRMQNLIDALLSYSRTNASDVVFKTTDLNSMLNEVKRNLYEDIKEKNVLIESVPLPELKVIPLQFHQLILNLIANAIKYSRSGVRPHIKISAGLVAANLESVARQMQFVSYDSEIEEECIPEYWRISIADNGIGFRQEHANKIFELFQRLHGKAEFEGTGIGLAICKKITQNHRGFMNAIGEPGVGATFNIFLPLR
jgi:light-regulated signal transduction histidine kinase (bacteriophytochrome)